MSGDVDRTLWVGNLSEKVTDELLYELFLQVDSTDTNSVFLKTKIDGDLQNDSILRYRLKANANSL